MSRQSFRVTVEVYPSPAFVLDVTAVVGGDDRRVWAEVDGFPGCFAAAEPPTGLRAAVEDAVNVYLRRAATAEDS